MFALYYRDTIGGGQGQYIDLAVYEGLFRLQEYQPALWDKMGILQERTGNDFPGTAPLGIWKSRDDHWVSITCSTDPVFRRLSQAMGRPELATDPRFVSQSARAENREEINRIVEEWTKEHTLKEVVDILDDAGVPAGPVQNMADIFQDPLFWERENIIEVQDPDIGPVKMPNVIGKFSLTPGRVRSTAPRLGEHNDEVFRHLLGYSEEKIAALRAAGVI
jgi:crotonobetainyl-CoA:carnitine CoA-transferase CaiB-like acyl-CoA transferase